MPIVTVKSKFQVVIPAKVRRQAGIKVGDVLEAKLERGKVTLTPKSLVDRVIAESLEDFKRGPSYGPFASAEEMVASLTTNARKTRGRKAKRPPR